MDTNAHKSQREPSERRSLIGSSRFRGRIWLSVRVRFHSCPFVVELNFYGSDLLLTRIFLTAADPQPKLTKAF